MTEGRSVLLTSQHNSVCTSTVSHTLRYVKGLLDRFSTRWTGDNGRSIMLSVLFNNTVGC